LSQNDNLLKDQPLYRDLPDPIFKEITRLVAVQAKMEAIETEYQQTFRGDLVLKASKRRSLMGTLFDFFLIYNIVEFKSENDKFDATELAKLEARARLLIAQHIGATYGNTLNVVVCSHKPVKVLNLIKRLGYQMLQVTPWLILCKCGLVEIMIVTCHQLPFEKRYYPWLVFTPSDNKRWREVIQLFLEQEQYQYLAAMRSIRVKEFAMLDLSSIQWENIISHLSPEKRAQLENEQEEASEEFFKIMQRTGRKDRINNVLSTLAPEDRVAGLAPEDRVAGLAPEELYKGMNEEQLQQLEKLIAERKKLQAD